MLDPQTKRRIDTCRDILVGKIPDPKSQVEQITIALIYKFMDDMDLESEELGGQRKFFTGEFERYAWARLVAPGTSGQEMLNTYSEALTRMPENRGLPTLFRDIFRNAYLPYRDPETLRGFLREIDGFTYDHSERLGDAFEYLLSVLGSQGDAGQFRTPRHIIDFMVEIIDPKRDEVILDPACGTAGFLISSYKHIMKANTSEIGAGNEIDDGDEHSVAERPIESPLRFRGDLLTPDDRQRLATNIKGYDISPDMVRLSLVNLYLHGFASPQVEEYDTLTNEDKWNEVADVILANPPFMSPKGGIPVHRRFAIQSKRSEVLFVDYIAEHLTPLGRAAVIVPEGIIFQSQSSYCELRRMLVENYLVGVVSLPAGVFNPYSGVKTSILILDRSIAKTCDRIAFFKIDNDGFNLGAQRRPVKGGQLSQAQADLCAWLTAVRGGEGAALDSTFGHAVAKARLAETGEYNLSGERYREADHRIFDIPRVAISEVCTINPKKSEVQDRPPDTEVSFVPMAAVPEHEISFAPAETRQLREVLASYTYFAEGDVLLAKVTPCFENGKAGIAKGLVNGIGFGSSELYVLRPSPDALAQWIYRCVMHPSFRDAATANMTGTGGLQRVPRDFLERFQIPLPPLDVQRDIVTEIEGYQKVIDGARAVVENYRPYLVVDKAWPLVEIKEVAAVESGYGFPLHAQGGEGEAIPFLKVSDMNLPGNEVRIESWNHSVSRETLCGLKAKSFPAGTVIFPKIGAAIATNKKRILAFESAYDNNVMGIVPNTELLDPRFLHTYLLSFDLSRWASDAQPPSMRKTVVEAHKIPLPPLASQKAIAAEIEAEQSLANANRELIVRFERKIETTLARLWSGVDTQGDA